MPNESAVAVQMARRLRTEFTHCVTALRKWEKKSERFTATAQDVVNSSLRESIVADARYWGCFHRFPAVQREVTADVEMDVFQLQEKLSAEGASLVQVVSSARDALERLRAVTAEISSTCGSEGLFGTAVIPSISPDRLATEVEKCVEMITKELSVKLAICGDIGKCKDRGTLTAYLSTLLTSPYVKEEKLNSLKELANHPDLSMK